MGIKKINIAVGCRYLFLILTNNTGYYYNVVIRVKGYFRLRIVSILDLIPSSISFQPSLEPGRGFGDKFILMLRVAHGVVAVLLKDDFFWPAGQMVNLSAVGHRHHIICFAVKNQYMADG